MSYMDEAPFPEPFGPIYERPAPEPCPDCECCSLRLCEKAKAEHTSCAAQSGEPRLVAGCRCTAGRQAVEKARAERQAAIDQAYQTCELALRGGEGK